MERFAHEGLEHEPVVWVGIHTDHGIDFAGSKLVQECVRWKYE
jgi:hypothetical protein